jgi:hypothetical protein
MSWQVRGGRRYYYHAIKRNRRTVNHYLGSGPLAEIAAARAESRALARKRHRQEVEALRHCLDPLAALTAVVAAGADQLLEASLRGQGFYQSSRRWVGFRRVRSLANTDSTACR